MEEVEVVSITLKEADQQLALGGGLGGEIMEEAGWLGKAHGRDGLPRLSSVGDVGKGDDGFANAELYLTSNAIWIWIEIITFEMLIYNFSLKCNYLKH